jgi:very-short-patch-repair endonuclease
MPAHSNSPIYEPPYDSPIEDSFAWDLVKYLRKDVEFIPQFEVRTSCGTFRVDFLCSLNGRTIGFECDGKNYHSNKKRDEWRDALIMGTGKLNAIYRIPGKYINYDIGRAIYLLSLYEEQIFTERALINLETLGQADIDKVWESENRVRIVYKRYPDELAYLHDDQDLHEEAHTIANLELSRCIDSRWNGREPTWLPKARLASRFAGESLDTVMEVAERLNGAKTAVNRP